MEENNFTINCSFLKKIKKINTPVHVVDVLAEDLSCCRYNKQSNILV